ncbi:MAG TPA: hypothetical protein VME17_22950 [Bryobacteraceae bacterium]|nr:hypothetical protein [Bryobacteraceae bacterium]
MHPITFVIMGLFFALLYLRYRRRQRKTTRSPRQQQLRTVKFLLAALVAGMAVHYSLQHTLAKMDGSGEGPSLVERLAALFSKQP